MATHASISEEGSSKAQSLQIKPWLDDDDGYQACPSHTSLSLLARFFACQRMDEANERPDYCHGGLCVQAIDVLLDPIGLNWRPLVSSSSAWPHWLSLDLPLPRIPAPGIFTPFCRLQGSGLLTTAAHHPTSLRTSRNHTSSMSFLFSFVRSLVFLLRSPFSIINGHTSHIHWHRRLISACCRHNT